MKPEAMRPVREVEKVNATKEAPRSVVNEVVEYCGNQFVLQYSTGKERQEQIDLIRDAAS